MQRVMRRAMLAIAGTSLLAGCAAPRSDTTLTPRSASDLALAGPSVRLAPDWWTAIGDPQLNALVDAALADSPTLAVADARVRQAQATLAREDAADNPSVALDAQVQAARLSGRYTIPPPYGGSVRVLGTGQAGLAWDLDLFGRQKAAIAGARSGLAAAAYDVAAARVMLSGAVVSSYAEVARAERQAAIARETIEARQRTVRLIDVRVRNQLASRLDATAATTLLDQARLALTRAEAARVLATQAIAALTGHGPSFAGTIRPTALRPERALPLPATVPADLLARRADIAAARARIDAAAAGRRVARRAFLPNINLSALVGLQAIGIGNFVDLDSGTAGGGAAIHLPLFDNGTLHANLDAATAGVDLATASYNQAIVDAARDAADAIARAKAADFESQRQRAVVAGFAETGRLNAIRVASGLDSRLDLIDNDVRLLDARLSATNLSIDALVARAQLAVALGGGFDPVQDLTP